MLIVAACKHHEYHRTMVSMWFSSWTTAQIQGSSSVQVVGSWKYSIDAFYWTSCIFLKVPAHQGVAPSHNQVPVLKRSPSELFRRALLAQLPTLQALWSCPWPAEDDRNRSRVQPISFRNGPMFRNGTGSKALWEKWRCGSLRPHSAAKMRSMRSCRAKGPMGSAAGRRSSLDR